MSKYAVDMKKVWDTVNAAICVRALLADKEDPFLKDLFNQLDKVIGNGGDDYYMEIETENDKDA